MPYDTTFFEQYDRYLREPQVRRGHDEMLDHLLDFMSPIVPRVLDLGCGIGEYYSYFEPTRFVPRTRLNYFGVDKERHGPHCSLIFDYTQRPIPLPFEPNCFISLFSAECCLDAPHKYSLYNDLFNEIPSLHCGFVSGFYYRSQAELEKVEEAGGLTSYQTIEWPTRFPDNVFSEWRNEIDMPSDMFGYDVVEVWKLLVRK